MDKAKISVQEQFSQPIRQIIMMLVVAVFAGAVVFIAGPHVLPVFTANLWLNGFILMVFGIGVISCFAQMAQLVYCVRWLEKFTGDKKRNVTKAPQLLAPLATMLRSRGAAMRIAESSTRSILDSVGTRIEEAREITRYIVNLLIFLGLLGTFYGLATTVPALVETIRSLAPREGEGGFEVFTRLMNGLEAQLAGMGVAFASSLIGLAGSLIVGLLELLAGHGQNRFYRELEEWLSSITRLGFSAGDSESRSEQTPESAIYLQMSEHLDRIHEMYSDSDGSRSKIDQKMDELFSLIERLAARMEANAINDDALARVASGQERLLQVLSNIERSEEMDAESRMRLRSIDVQMLRLLEEISTGRQESMTAFRSEFRTLVKSILNQSRDNQKRTLSTPRKLDEQD